jgi:archaellum biogenesis protein FlaJ (TadC family)
MSGKLVIYVAAAIALALETTYVSSLSSFKQQDPKGYEKYKVVEEQYKISTWVMVLALIAALALVGAYVQKNPGPGNEVVAVIGLLGFAGAWFAAQTTYILVKFREMEPEAYKSYRAVVSDEKWKIVGITLAVQAVVWGAEYYHASQLKQKS